MLFVRLRRCLFSIALMVGSVVHAQYPDKPIRLVVPFAPGGNIDATARIVASGLSEVLGQSILVDNRPGASGTIGSEFVARSAPDGYTMLLAATGSLPPKQLMPQMKIDPVADFAGAASISRTPLVLVVRSSLPAADLRSFIEQARSSATPWTYGSPGTGTTAHLSTELFQRAVDARFLHVPYKGSSQAVADLLGGQIDFMFDQLNSSLPHVRSGKLRAIAITTRERSPLLPDVPSIAERVPDFEVATTTGLVFSAGTPRNQRDIVGAAVAKVLANPAHSRRFEALGSAVAAGDGDAFMRVLRDDVRTWEKAVADAGIQPP